jgi:hypothetical protein
MADDTYFVIAQGVTISPEYYTTLINWISFSWVTPLAQRGIGRKLNEDDVYALSETNKSKALFAKWVTIDNVSEAHHDGIVKGQANRMSLLRRMWEANSSDIMYVPVTIGDIDQGVRSS